MKALLILLFIILIFHGCASTPEIKAVASPDQKISYDGAVISQKKHLVSLSRHTDFLVNKYLNNKTIFHLIIQNCGEKPILITSDNISVIYEGDGYDQSSKIIKIEPYRALSGDLNTKLFESIRFSTSGSEIAISSAHKEATSQNKERIAHEIRVLKDALPKIIMNPHTIIPDDAISVMFVCDTQDLDPKIEGRFKIVITVDGEKHEFIFIRSIEP